MDILEQVQIMLSQEHPELDAADECRTTAKLLSETELGWIINEEIRAAAMELVEEQRRVIRKAVEEHKRIIREVVEEEKLSIRAKVGDIRQSIFRLGGA